MAKAFLYVVKASPDPDRITCTVPWRVDGKLIFFGPCKKRIREYLRRAHLSPTIESAAVADAVYLVGVNGRNPQRVRKVVWAGRLRRVLTFARAWADLAGPRYQKMRERKCSPLHLKPVYQNSRWIGYEHRGREHEEDDGWVLDLVKKRQSAKVRKEGKQLLLQPGVSPWDGFPRDACLVLDNLFFAQGAGLPVDKGLLNILRRRQPQKKIDAFALFGYQRNNVVEGLAGRWLPLDDPLASELVAWIEKRAGRTPQSHELAAKPRLESRCR